MKFFLHFSFIVCLKAQGFAPVGAASRGVCLRTHQRAFRSRGALGAPLWGRDLRSPPQPSPEGCTYGCERSRAVSADTPKGFPLALWKPSGHAIGIGGERLPLGVLECRPLLPTVARPTIQSILRGRLSPPSQQRACGRKTGKRKKRAIFPRATMCIRKNGK